MKATRSLLPILLLALAALLAPAIPAHAAGDTYFLSLPPLLGNSTDPAHKNDIVVTGFQYPGVSGSSHTFYIEKGFDSASPGLLLASVTGQVFSSGIFYCTKATGGGAGVSKGGGRIFTMNFGDLVVSSWQTFDNGTEDLAPVERVYFTFSTLSLVTYPQGGGIGLSGTTPVFSPPMVN